VPELITFPGVLMAAGGHIVFDGRVDAYTRATSGERPETVNPSLWRQSEPPSALYVRSVNEAQPGFSGNQGCLGWAPG
jgi:hypothetical protein